ncbi:MAG TPA: molybdopterin-binding protein [Candidatus Azoamicus sp.]
MVLGSLKNIPDYLKKIFAPKCIDLTEIKVVIITMSDRSFIGSYKDISGQIIIDFLKIRKATIKKKLILPDNNDILENIISNIKDIYNANIIIVNGGTGINHKDITYNTLLKLCDKNIVGITELLRLYGSSYSNYSWLSSSFAGCYKTSVILSFPGNPSSVIESLNVLEDILPHILNLRL